MSGKLCIGQPLYNTGAARVSESKSYCDGMAYRASGTLVGKPKADNPHLADSPDSDAWNLGWDLAEAAEGGTMTKALSGCCATMGAIAS